MYELATKMIWIYLVWMGDSNVANSFTPSQISKYTCSKMLRLKMSLANRDFHAWWYKDCKIQNLLHTWPRKTLKVCIASTTTEAWNFCVLSITPIDVLGSLLTGYGSGYYVHGGLVIYSGRFFAKTHERWWHRGYFENISSVKFKKSPELCVAYMIGLPHAGHNSMNFEILHK